MDDVVDEVRTLLRIKRKLSADEKDNFGIVTPDAISGMIGSMTAVFSTVILIVPGIALIVGAIVIMNIMLVAVTERTKEIGIRKSLGARQADILRQFLFESGLLSAIGGLIGLIIAYTAGYLITLYVFPTQHSLVRGGSCHRCFGRGWNSCRTIPGMEGGRIGSDRGIEGRLSL